MCPSTTTTRTSADEGLSAWHVRRPKCECTNPASLPSARHLANRWRRRLVCGLLALDRLAMTLRVPRGGISDLSTFSLTTDPQERRANWGFGHGDREQRWM